MQNPVDHTSPTADLMPTPQPPFVFDDLAQARNAAPFLQADNVGAKVTGSRRRMRTETEKQILHQAGVVKRRQARQMQ